MDGPGFELCTCVLIIGLTLRNFGAMFVTFNSFVVVLVISAKLCVGFVTCAGSMDTSLLNVVLGDPQVAPMAFSSVGVNSVGFTVLGGLWSRSSVEFHYLHRRCNRPRYPDGTPLPLHRQIHYVVRRCSQPKQYTLLRRCSGRVVVFGCIGDMI